MTQEIELKLEVGVHDLATLLGSSLLADAQQREEVDQVTTYYDSRKSTLRKHGFTLRVREAKGKFVQTVKPASNAAGLMEREEIETELTANRPDLSGFVDHAVLGEVDAAKLRPIICSEVRRTSGTFSLGNAMMQFDLDQGVIAADERSETFNELELELLDGEPVNLIIAARRLLETVPLRLGVLTKAERGFRLASGAANKISKAEPLAIGESKTVAEWFEAIMHACLRHYRLNEVVVLQERRKEALHQARVAMRRLRSAFTLFKPAVEDVEFAYLKEEIRWFTSELGDARNLDVYLERELPPEEREGLLDQRERAYDAVIAAMNSPRFLRAVIDLVGWLGFGAWRRGKLANSPVGPFAAVRLQRLWRSITAVGSDIDRMETEVRHRLRIQVKKIRYAVEFLRSLYSDQVDREKVFVGAVADLQEALGKLNDIATAQQLGAEEPDDSWLIGSYETRRHLLTAQAAFREAVRAGPFWQADQHA